MDTRKAGVLAALLALLPCLAAAAPVRTSRPALDPYAGYTRLAYARVSGGSYLLRSMPLFDVVCVGGTPTTCGGGGGGGVQLGGTNAWTGPNSFIDGNFSILGSGDATKILKFEVDGFTSGATRTVTFPDANLTVAGLATTNAFTGTNSFLDGTFSIKNTADATKVAVFTLAGFTTGTTRTFTLPNATTTLVGLSTANVFTSSNEFSGSGQVFFGPAGSFATGNQFFYNTALTPDGMYVGISTTSESLNFAEYQDSGFDFQNGPCGTSACVDPTFIGRSHNQSTTQWWSLTHNATDIVFAGGVGGLDVTGIIGAWKLNRTITAGGTTGAQTINKISGTVNFAAAATSLVVTNSLVNTSSIVFTTIRTADATCTFVKSVVPAAGSFTITVNAGCTAETSVGFRVDN